MRTTSFRLCGGVLGVLFVSVACSDPSSNSGGAQVPADAAGGVDAGLDAGGGEEDSQSTPDTVTGDAQADDSAAQDTAVDDTTRTEPDAGPTDVVDDAQQGDAAGPDVPGDDASAEDTAADVEEPDSGPPEPSLCTTDADCGADLSQCLLAKCDAATGACSYVEAADGASCESKALCAGPGQCKKGACVVQNLCAPITCAPAAVQCGDKVTVALGSLGESKMGKNKCSDVDWDGGEKVMAVAVNEASVVKVEVTGDVAEVGLMAIGGGADLCDPEKCDGGGLTLTLGLQPGQQRLVALESLKTATGEVTVSITCDKLEYCGDGTCGGDETCGTCAKDCGQCPCGDGKCEPGVESCATCEQDCGPCPAECQTKDTPTCSGCSCETCVCDQDKFCCETAWDNLCVTQCSDDCGGPDCSTEVCGDDVCEFTEFDTCPNDCPPLPKCGDGICVSGLEGCQECPADCGFCDGPKAECGDGECSDTEHCGACPADCGSCSMGCETKDGPGCPGCSCEACVCAADAFCCNSAWDGLCVSQCIEDCGGGSCPEVICGDGLCSEDESCDTCPADCGICPIVCGDGNCDATESAQSCPADCAPGCQGKCGTSAASQDDAGKPCYCDDSCEGWGDCCPDKAEFCPKAP